MGVVIPIIKAVATIATAATAVKAFTAKAPEPAAIAPAPTIEPVKPIPEEKEPITRAPEAARDIAKEEEKKRRRKRGRAKTLLTGPRGVLAEPTVAKKTLLGE